MSMTAPLTATPEDNEQVILNQTHVIKELKQRLTRLDSLVGHMKLCENCSREDDGSCGNDEGTAPSQIDPNYCINNDRKCWEIGV